MCLNVLGRRCESRGCKTGINEKIKETCEEVEMDAAQGAEDCRSKAGHAHAVLKGWLSMRIVGLVDE